MSIVYQSEAVNEPNRIFSNLGDELSDVFLQLIALADRMNIDMYNIRNLKPLEESDWLAFPVLFGQLNEAVMEKYGYRFNKPRSGFSTTDDFIENRILRLFDITYQIAEKYHLDIEQEFSLMLDDANAFLKRFADSKRIEYIDAYNENHQFIGRFEKHKAHELGLWHDVLGSLVINPNKNEVFFQLKNHKHNNINKYDLLEITAGGHLRAGESLEDGVREIKEETGLQVSFEDMVPSGIRKCDTDNNMTIREFQYFYLLPLDIDLQDLNPNEDESIAFVKMDIDIALEVIINNQSAIGNIYSKGNIRECSVNREWFDPAFINNGVFISLLQQAQFYSSNYKGVKK